MEDLEINWDAIEAPAKQAAIGNIEANPEVASTALKLAKTTGAPPAAIEQDPSSFELQAKAKKATDALTGDRDLQNFVLKNPMASKVMNDDWAEMGQFSRTMKKLQTPMFQPEMTEQQAYEDFIAAGGDPAEYSLAREGARKQAITSANQFIAGRLQYERGEIGSGRLGIDQLGMEPTAEDRVKQIEESLKVIGEPKGIIEEIFNMMGNLAGSAGPTFAGAAAGSVIPAFGTGAGALTAFSVDQGRVAAGNKYLDLTKAKVSPGTAALASVFYGSVVGAMNAVGGETVAKPWVEMGTKMSAEAVNKIVADRGTRMVMENAAKELFRGSAVGAAIMGLQTYASEVADAIALTFTKPENADRFETIFNSPLERSRMTDQVVTAMVHGAQLIGALHLPGVGANMVMDGLYVRQAKINQSLMDRIVRDRDATKVYQRSPEMIGEFVEGQGFKNFGIDPTVALQLHKDNPGAFSFIPDFEQKANEALQTGGKLEVSPAAYLQHINTDLHSQLKDDLSVNEGLTVNEAKVLEENPPKYDEAPPTPAGYVTAKGSEYVIHEDGTTTRNKAARPDAGHEGDSGLKPRSERTVYVADDASVLSAAGLSNIGNKGARLIIRDGKASLLTWNEKEGKWGIAPGSRDIPISDVPALGMHPLELWGKADDVPGYEAYSNQHAGNKITEIRGVPKEEIPVPEAVVKDPAANAAFQNTLMQVVEQAQANARAAGLNAIFRDAKAAGMTKAEFAIYAKRIEEAQQAVTDKAVQAAEKEARKRLTELWKKRSADMAEEVRSELEGTPEIKTLDYLSQKGPAAKIKLDRAEVEHMLGVYAGNRADYPGELPKGILAKDGVHPDVLAKMLGHETGLDLLTVLSRLEAERAEGKTSFPKVYEGKVEAETNTRMEAKYGGLDDAVREAALEAALNGKQLEVLSKELAQIVKIGGIDLPITKAALESTVADIFNKVTVGKNTVERWTAQAGKMGRQAELMLLRGKFVEAAKAKQRQMLAVRLAQEAKDFAKEAERFERSIAPVLKNESVARYDQEYVSQLQKMLSVAFGYKMKRDSVELFRNTPEGLEAFVEKKGEQGTQLDIPTFLTDSGFTPRKPEELKVEEHRELQDFVKQMLHNAKEEKTLEVNGEMVALQDARARAIASAQGLSQAWQAGKAEVVKGAALHTVRVWDAMNIRIERLLSWLDQRDPNGPWNQLVTRPMQAGKHYVMEKSKEVSTYLRDLPKIERPNDIVAGSPLRNSLGHTVETTRENLIAAMLNVGNQGNLTVLARGYHTTTAEIMGWIHANATQRDWNFVSSVWDLWEKHLWKDQERTAIEMTGVGLRKVEPMEIQTPFGTIKGGYYPLVEDFTSIDKKVRGDKNMLVGQMPPVPTATYMKRRTGAAYPLDLDLGRLGSKIGEAIHYIGYAKAWKDASKFLDSPALLDSIDKAFGKEYRDQLQVWMNDVATNGGMYQRTGLEPLVRALQFGRQNAVMMLIGFKPGTAVLHGGAAFFNSLTEVGMRPFARAAYDLVFRNTENMEKYTEMAYRLSPELRNRKQSLDRDVAAAIQRLQTEGKFYGARAAYINWSTKMVAALDQYSATPTWLAAYTKYMTEFEGKYADAESRAVFAADQVVRNAHGANGIVDLPAIMRGGGAGREMFKFFTMFGGFYNHIYNQVRDRGMMGPEAIRALADGNFTMAQAKAMGVVGGFMGYILAGSLWHSAIRGNGSGEDAEWDVGGYAAHSVGEQMLSTQPILRDVAFWWKTGGRGKINLAGILDDIATGIAMPFKSFTDIATGKRDFDKVQKKTRQVAELPGWAFGIGPSRTISNWMQYATDYNYGDARAPSGIYEWRNLVLDARAPVKRNKK